MDMTDLPPVFLFDIDNTLLDNDRVIADLHDFVSRRLGDDAQAHFWAIFEDLREELGYADYLGAVQRFRAEQPRELAVLDVSGFLLEYSFAERLFPGALDVLTRCRTWGLPVLFSDGDAVMQPWKASRSGLRAAVEDRVLIYIHKEQELADVAQRFPALHYIMLDDKLRLLAKVKEAWESRVTTVFLRQGHYAHDRRYVAGHRPADISVDRIADLLNSSFADFLVSRSRAA